MRIALVANPGAGRGLDLDAVSEALERHGARIVARADVPGELDPSDAERIVVVSGDGTIGPAAELAAKLEVPLAVVPGGTANDFARALGLPDDPAEALRLAATGERLRHLELARMDGQPFVNQASAGLSPAAARRAAPFKGRLGALAYPVGGVLAGAREQPVAVTATADGEEVFAGRAWQVTVAATGAFGGGAGIEEADPQDGELDLVVVPGGSRAGLPPVALAMLRGTVASRPGVVHRRASRLELRLPARTSFNVDGEVVQAGERVSFSAHAGAFALVVAERDV